MTLRDKQLMFFIGWHQPGTGQSSGKSFDYAMYSINRLEKRKSDFYPSKKGWMLDSGAFTRITSGKGHLPVKEYASQILRWKHCGNLMAVVCQDWMCEDFVLQRTGLSIQQHQQLTLENYRVLHSLVGDRVYVMPVLQGFRQSDYLQHLDDYGDLLFPGQWVGVGSVCKRNRSHSEIETLLRIIKSKRPDIKLHGFGVKKTALQNSFVNALLHSADSAAGGLSLGKGKNKYPGANSPEQALAYYREITQSPIQLVLDFETFKL